MCLHHTQTRTHARRQAGAHLHLLALLPFFFFPDLGGCCSSILHTQRFPPLPLHSVHMSYEGMREGDEGAREWAGLRFFGERGGAMKEDALSPKTCLN